MVSERWKAIYAAINGLTKVGYTGSETDTEVMFNILSEAVCDVQIVDWEKVERSHEDGLAYDVAALLATRIEEALPHYGQER
jgi:hypothetical protein